MFNFLLFINLICIQNSANDVTIPDSIEWRKEIKLSWENFQTIEDSISDLGALSNLSIFCDFNRESDSLIIVTKTLFIRKGSWIVSKNKSTELLKHEQIHFDIAEIYRRKLVDLLSKSIFYRKGYANDIKTHYNKLFKEYKTEQSKYDLETDHSKNIEKQKEWNILIAKKLEINGNANTNITKILLK